ncbi:MAG TPA: GDSL-type esterase/lipase family protein [Ktedonobacteraceae bacterium]|nr:GDSL-type esterase/lipase family protein [Ktedonobacteraceae bacterium]
MPHRTRPIHFFCIFLVFTFILTACSNVSSQSSNAHPVQQKRTTQSTPIFMPGGPVTYVALGASDAVGIGSNIPGSQGYVPLVAAHLPKKSHLINLGISGIQLHQALSQELPLALSTSPNLITIWLVANDFIGGVTYDNYFHDLNFLLQDVHVSTHARIVMANLPDLTRLPAFANDTPSQKAQMLVAIQKWNKEIAQLAKKYGVALVDLFSQGSQITAHPEYISGDGFHPSPAGYVQLANYFWQVIEGGEKR